jgi:hypothetical protein
MGLKKAKYVIKSCKDCPFYRYKHIYEADDELPPRVYDYYEHYCNGQCVEEKDLKLNWFLNKEHCYLIYGYSVCNVPEARNNVGM